MFIITAKLPRRGLAVGFAVILLCCCLALAHHARPDPGPAVSTVSTAAADTRGIRTNSDRRAYLASFGWEVSEKPISAQELLIPEVMDERYDEYLALQSAQGFDLNRYAGKRVKRYTYEIKNHPSGEKNIRANLLIWRGRVIGGEVLSPTVDGFLHGLSKPAE